MSTILVPETLHKIIEPKHQIPTEWMNGVAPAGADGNPSREQMSDIVKAAISAGFGIGAIVVRRNQALGMRRSVANWGVVQSTFSVPPYNATYAPLEILWWGSGYATPTKTKMWPHELFLVNAAYKPEDLEVVFQAQE